ncbi:MBL fold metallo-hydrolase [Brevibacillus choshinensis]|uniref:MBL fold metallo-hydrolase n=1 Tax=Brevibacillus choshinensis TaxID=54911 RepID=UPI002E248553|nr:MBL fold metallo-hydrolase [Brevibacillus choshinensis]MED4782365.1 MBL fold metallo-hydrolase [Brevibacillus choshinensis]
MKIAEGLEMLPLTLGMGGNTMVINPTVVYDANACVLIDTGMPGCYETILNQIKEAGIPTSNLHSVILTHQDIDHVGSLPQFLAEASQPLNVFAHADDKASIDGDTPILKLPHEMRGAILQALPEKQREEFEKAFSPETGANVTRVVTDGEVLPFGGGLQVIHTPGHTPGHICLYHEASQTLIAGDAMIVANGELQGPRAQVTPDMDAALRSLKKLAAFPIETVICYHGGIYKGDVKKRLEEIAASVQ